MQALFLIFFNFLIFFFGFSYESLENLYLDDTLLSQLPVKIILVTETHQYFIHNTLGDFKKSPLPRRFQAFTKVRAFYF